MDDASVCRTQRGSRAGCQTDPVTGLWVETTPVRRTRLVIEVLATLGLGLLGLVVGAITGLWSIAVTVLLLVAVLVRRRLLPLTAVLAVAAAIPQLVNYHAVNPVADLAYAPICYAMGAHRERAVRRAGLAAAVAATLLPAVAWSLQEGANVGLHTLTFAAAVAATGAVVAVGGWAFGFIQWQSRHAVEEQVAAQLLEADRRRLADAYEQLQERGRIATDMHDVVAHSWAVVAAQADGARYVLRDDPGRAEEALDVIGETARAAITDLRRILQELRHGEATEGTIGPEQQQVLLDRMTASGMRLDFAEYGERPVSPLLTLTAYRLMAEALTNALKHGDSREPVTVTLRWDDGLALEIRNRIGADRGVGTGHGILGMTERVQLSGGTLSAGPSGPDWVLHARVPDPGAATPTPSTDPSPETHQEPV